MKEGDCILRLSPLLRGIHSEEITDRGQQGSMKILFQYSLLLYSAILFTAPYSASR